MKRAWGARGKAYRGKKKSRFRFFKGVSGTASPRGERGKEDDEKPVHSLSQDKKKRNRGLKEGGGWV